MSGLTLPSGLTYGYDAAGKRVCTGTQMGRRDTLPDDPLSCSTLIVTQLAFCDGDYDAWGAYWGGGDPIYCAWNHLGVRVFVRAKNRKEAFVDLQAIFPNTILVFDKQTEEQANEIYCPDSPTE
jgi:YD repeat-containing protein